MATHSSVLAWRIPGTGEPGGLLSLWLHRVGHDWSYLAAAAAAAAAADLLYSLCILEQIASGDKSLPSLFSLKSNFEWVVIIILPVNFMISSGRCM